MADLRPCEPRRVRVDVDHVQVHAEAPAARVCGGARALQLVGGAEGRGGRIDVRKVSVETVALPAVDVEEQVVAQAELVGAASDQVLVLGERAVPRVHAELASLCGKPCGRGRGDVSAESQRAVERAFPSRHERERGRLAAPEAEGAFRGGVEQRVGRRGGGDDKRKAVGELKPRVARGVVVSVERNVERAGILHAVTIAEEQGRGLFGTAAGLHLPERRRIACHLGDERIALGAERDGR